MLKVSDSHGNRVDLLLGLKGLGDAADTLERLLTG